jgi:parvulin-like peptidyl-prolyl isomerase
VACRVVALSMNRVVRSSRSWLLLGAALSLLAALPLATGCGHATPGAPTSPGPSSGSPSAVASAGAVVATVNGSPVRAGDVDVVRAERRLLGQDDAAASALREAIERNLMYREAERLHLAPRASSVASRLAEVESGYGGADALDNALQSAGSSRGQLQRSVADGVLREALRNAKFPELAATPTEVRAYYHRNRERLFTRPASVHLGAIEVRTRMVAENAIRRLRQGRPFAEVARQLSIDPESKASGGDIGWVLTSSLPPGARGVVAGAGTGVIEKPLRGNGAWYVFDVIARRAERVASFADVRDRISTELTDVARSKALQTWLAEARGRAEITKP